MALFPKLPAKRHAPPKPDTNAGRDGSTAPGAPAAKGNAGASGYRPVKSPSGGITITGFGLVEASPTRRVIEVTHGNAGMCAVLENAVLLYASGHAEAARTLLAEGVGSDPETQLSPLAWLALFDLLQRAGDRSAFEQLALQYVVRFERSAPAWNDRIRPPADPRAPVAGYVGVTGKLTAGSATQIESLKRAIATNVSQARFDLAAITDFDDAGARLLADVLGEARRKQYPLRLQRQDRLRHGLEAAVRKGQAGGEGAWLLSLELLQWQGDRAAFDDRAVDYAVTFEVSPPSWEPPLTTGDVPPPAAEAGEAIAAAAETDPAGAAYDAETLAWSGVVAGPHPAQVAKLAEFANGRNVVPVEMREVERIDFVGAGAIYNAIKSVEDQRKVVQIFGATPIIRAILLLIGVSSGHFHKKSN
jgi:anti-anti-sigma regulatory factor